MTGLSDKAAHQCRPVCNTGAGSDDEIFGDNVMPDIDRSGFRYCLLSRFFSREAPSIVHLSADYDVTDTTAADNGDTPADRSCFRAMFFGVSVDQPF